MGHPGLVLRYWLGSSLLHVFSIILEQVVKDEFPWERQKSKDKLIYTKIFEALASITLSNILLTKAAHVTGTNVNEGGKHPSP